MGKATNKNSSVTQPRLLPQIQELPMLPKAMPPFLLSSAPMDLNTMMAMSQMMGMAGPMDLVQLQAAYMANALAAVNLQQQQTNSAPIQQFQIPQSALFSPISLPFSQPVLNPPVSQALQPAKTSSVSKKEAMQSVRQRLMSKMSHRGAPGTTKLQNSKATSQKATQKPATLRKNSSKPVYQQFVKKPELRVDPSKKIRNQDEQFKTPNWDEEMQSLFRDTHRSTNDLIGQARKLSLGQNQLYNPSAFFDGEAVSPSIKNPIILPSPTALLNSFDEQIPSPTSADNDLSRFSLSPSTEGVSPTTQLLRQLVESAEHL